MGYKIVLEDIRAGDELIITDSLRNSAKGHVAVEGNSLMVEAFGTYIEVATRSREGKLNPVHGIKIVAHQAGLWDE